MIIAIDPGRTTGIAELWKDYNVNSFEIKGDMKLLYNLLYDESPSHIVCEQFQYQQRSQRVDLFPRELIGVVKLYCQKNGITLSLQPAAHAKKLFETEKLKKLHLWEPNRPHAMDAIRHLLYFVTVEQKDNYFVNQLRTI